MNRPHVTINLNRLAENIRSVSDDLGDKTALIFVVKSDAYGHGLARTVRCAVEQGVQHFAVAYLHEALQVRSVAPDATIFILGAVGPEDAGLLITHHLTPMVMSIEHARALSDAAINLGVVKAHLKVDSGMGRLGIISTELPDQIEELVALPQLELTGIASHFAAVEPQREELAAAQLARFKDAVTMVEAAAGRRLMRHISSSRAFQFYQEWDFDAVRPGIMLYGYGSRERGMRFPTRPALEWRSYLMQVKAVPAGFPVGYYAAFTTDAPTDIGTLCVGYADGLLRSLSNHGYVLVGGRRCPIVGRISMNWVNVDLGYQSGSLAGDEVVLLGRQGDDAIWANEMAAWAGTIAYEILVNIRSDLARQYVYQD
jgi:alanine racemase